MGQVIGWGLVAGVLGANALPHFVRGILGQEFPALVGNGPVPNFVAGWACLVLAGLAAYAADLASHPAAGAASVAVGVLAMGLYHAVGGAAWLNARLGRANPDRY